MKRLAAIAALLVFGFGLFLPPYQVTAADLVDVTVRIKCVLQVENPDTASGDGDYFAEVKIDDHDFTIHPTWSGPLGPGPIEDDSFCPDWRFTRNVDRTGPIDIVIRLWDDDGGLNFGGDRMDINPKPGKVELSIRFSAHSGTWAISESDVQGNIARGNGDHGFPEANDGRIAQIQFEIFVGTNPDLDGDGIPDAIENNGVRRADGSLVTDLKALGADPCRKTIIVWIDYMNGAADGHSHKPKAAAIQEVVDTFDSAPLNAAPCPYGGNHKPTGMDFIYLEGKPIPEQPVMALGDDFRAARSANFPPELRPYAHYAIFVHDQKAGESSSGLCCESQDGYKDFIVSLGSWRTTCVHPGENGTLDTEPQGDDVIVDNLIQVGPDLTCNTTFKGDDWQILPVGGGAADARVGTVRDQSGTIMHELGHAIGLEHGGDEKTNHMPNYLSVMNYSFQFGIPRGTTPPGATTPLPVLDYSRSQLADLDKRWLLESDGIGSGLSEWTRWLDPDGELRWASAAGAIDWDWSESIDNGKVICNNGLSKCVEVDINADDDSEEPKDILTGFDDWNNLNFRAIDSPTAGPSFAKPHPQIAPLDFPTALQAEVLFLAAFDPDLATTKTVDKATAEGGDTLNYSVTVRNVGTGTASNVSVVDTFPAGQGKSPETRTIGTLYPGAQRVEAFNLTVACATPDGTVLVNSATASGTDMGGGAEANLTNNTATAATTIQAPRLEVTKTATGTGLAGEAITYQVTVTNVGSASATNVVMKDVLPVDVYYSQALDLGAGPKPDSVTTAPGGTTTLSWNLGTLAPAAVQTVEYTARPSLLFVAGESVTNAVEVVYQNSKGCTFGPEQAAAATTISEVTPSGDPGTIGFWRNHPELWQAEILARIQATDQRFDADQDGQLSTDEVLAVLSAGGNMDAILKQQMLATYFNLATRRINAGTLLDSKNKLVRQLGTVNTRDAVRYAMQTLLLPINNATRDRYSDATTILDLINNNKILIYK